MQIRKNYMQKYSISTRSNSRERKYKIDMKKQSLFDYLASRVDPDKIVDLHRLKRI